MQRHCQTHGTPTVQHHIVQRSVSVTMRNTIRCQGVAIDALIGPTHSHHNPVMFPTVRDASDKWDVAPTTDANNTGSGPCATNHACPPARRPHGYNANSSYNRSGIMHRHTARHQQRSCHVRCVRRAAAHAANAFARCGDGSAVSTSVSQST